MLGIPILMIYGSDFGLTSLVHMIEEIIADTIKVSALTDLILYVGSLLESFVRFVRWFLYGHCLQNMYMDGNDGLKQYTDLNVKSRGNGAKMILSLVSNNSVGQLGFVFLKRQWFLSHFTL